MRRLAFVIFVVSVAVVMNAQVTHFISTSQLISLASKAAQDEGYTVGKAGVYLDVLRTQDGKEPYSGYEAVGLYQAGHLIRTYAVRIETGDIVDPVECVVFRHHDLVQERDALTRSFGSQPITLDDLATEIGCDVLRTLPDKNARLPRGSSERAAPITPKSNVR